jgi:Protein of unknown function (DUF2939)
MLRKVPRNAAFAPAKVEKAPIARELSPKMLHGWWRGAGGSTLARQARIAIAAAALLAAAAAGWWFASPWWTLWRMREAAAAGDSAALASYIDFPALRASTRDQLGPRLGPLGGAAVHALVSPTALRLALLKTRPGSSSADLRLIRTGPSEFRLSRNGGRELVFRRHGLGWKLSEVRLVRAAD